MAKKRKQNATDKSEAKSKSPKRAKRVRMADSADKFALYEAAVQEASLEVEFMLQLWKDLFGTPVIHLREDFCGSAWICAEWVKSGGKREAVGVDLEPSVLEWGRKRHIEPLGKKAKRVRLLEENVLETEPGLVDMIAALNYSYFIFKTREQLRQYFRRAWEGLKDDGVLVLDAYGGSDAQVVLKERRRCEGFSYVWEQAYYNPINNDVTNHIHFHFPDRSKIKKAFTYEWRLWQIAELQELLLEAGFDQALVFWDEEDEDGDSTGNWVPVLDADNDPGWNAYIVGVKRSD